MNYIQPTLYDNVFDPQHLDIIEQKYLTWFQSGWHSNRQLSYDHGHMQNYIARPCLDLPIDLSIIPYNIRQHELLISFWNQIKTVLDGDRALYRAYSKAYHFGMDAYKHTDQQASKFTLESTNQPIRGNGFETCILYMNKEWNTDYFGQTVLYTDDNEIDMSVLPKYNRLFIFDSAQPHSTTPLSRHCPFDKQIIVFNSMPKELCDPGVEYLLEHTKAVKHFQGLSFFDHLWNVYNTLIALKQPHHVCLAGLWHAVYGTSAFDNPTKNKFTPDIVKHFIGEQAESLVSKFCSLPAPRVDVICQMKDIELAYIEYANLYDQNPDGRQNEKLSRLNLLIEDVKYE